MKVLKFGGTSVANAENIAKVIEIAKEESKNQKIAVVVSALAGITDKLLETAALANAGDEGYVSIFESIRNRHLQTAKLLLPDTDFKSVEEELEGMLSTLKKHLQGIFLLGEFSDKTKDKVVSFGELLSSFIISEALKVKVPSSVFKDTRELIVTDTNFTNAHVKRAKTEQRIQDYFQQIDAQVVLLPGFVSRSESGETTTLGRGGSDFTAALVAAGADASVLEIWTDVSGMFTANPKLVKQAYPISEISYQEAMELSHFGAKVLYAPTIQPVLQKEIPTHIKNTFEPTDEGTRISKHQTSKRGLIKGISHIDGMALLTLEGNGMVGVPGFAKRLFSALSRNQINIIIITQASSEHSICVGVYATDAELAKQAVDDEFAYEIALNKIKALDVETDLSIVAVVGDTMKSHQGVSGKMFSTLGQNNINVRAIAQGASERNISAVIASKDVKKALNTLHNRFFEKQVRTLHLFVVGVGNVGAILLEQIRLQEVHLRSHLMLQLKVVGIANSRKMVFNEAGIALNHWKKELENGVPMTNSAFFETVKTLNLGNSIFVDITANEVVAKTYPWYLKESISVVACNKIACSSAYSEYLSLKELSKEYGASFLFETNVGAGLPIIGTLNKLIHSGDEINSIQAVLSGSLNFVFNHFEDTNSFHDVVKLAQEAGYTEPDPRIDLSGVDVARKILILARESGFEINLEDVENDSFLPNESLEAKSVEDFYKSLMHHADHFQTLYDKARKKDCQLKYVAEFSNGKAQVGLREIPQDHPFYNLQGKDNIVLFYTQRYPEQPLIIKGAGAGAAVTASGLFGDIITLGTN